MQSEILSWDKITQQVSYSKWFRLRAVSTTLSKNVILRKHQGLNGSRPHCTLPLP